MNRSYAELSSLGGLRERFDYLSLQGDVGCPTFGASRYLNQGFYTSREWRDLRQYIIFRDGGCDLAVPDYVIYRRPLIHHINPITEQHILERHPCLLDPENLITTTHDTHNAIHYGDARLLPQEHVERYLGDTKEW